MLCAQKCSEKGPTLDPVHLFAGESGDQGLILYTNNQMLSLKNDNPNQTERSCFLSLLECHPFQEKVIRFNQLIICPPNVAEPNIYTHCILRDTSCAGSVQHLRSVAQKGLRSLGLPATKILLRNVLLR